MPVAGWDSELRMVASVVDLPRAGRGVCTGMWSAPMTTRSSAPILLATSGCGNRFGGIGVVTEHIRAALAEDVPVELAVHRLDLPRRERILRFFARVALSAARGVRFVLYEHVDLAQARVVHPQVPHVLFLHGEEMWRPLRGLRKWATQRAALLLSNSEFTVAEARRHNPWLPPVRITRLGVQPPLTWHPRRPEPIALLVGRMSAGERRKGHDWTFDGWPAIRRAVSDARLLVVGDGDDFERLAARVRNERLEGIEMLGRVDDETRNRLYAKSRVLLLPSLQEGFGLVAVEAASFGTPVVALAGTVLEELFPSGEGAVFAERATGDAVAEAVIPLLRGGDAAADLGARARRRVERELTISTFRASVRRELGPLLHAKSTVAHAIDASESDSR
jgi:glycosyltransferase involved in cell wall biosynthesis